MRNALQVLAEHLIDDDSAYAADHDEAYFAAGRIMRALSEESFAIVRIERAERWVEAPKAE